MVGPPATAIEEDIKTDATTTPTFDMIPAYRSCYDLAMRILAASLFLAVTACGAPPKKDTGIVQEGSDTAPTCCCKTVPLTDDKEITPVYAMQPRMECSTSNGECEDDVQCNGSHPSNAPSNNNGVPPPPPISSSPSDPPIK
jgi:hypothetical protein